MKEAHLRGEGEGAEDVEEAEEEAMVLVVGSTMVLMEAGVVDEDEDADAGGAVDSEGVAEAMLVEAILCKMLVGTMIQLLCQWKQFLEAEAVDVEDSEEDSEVEAVAFDQVLWWN